jgi:hypothetical protein
MDPRPAGPAHINLQEIPGFRDFGPQKYAAFRQHQLLKTLKFSRKEYALALAHQVCMAVPLPARSRPQARRGCYE